MKKFAHKALLFFAPFLLVVLTFFALDPFSMFHNSLNGNKCAKQQAIDAKKTRRFKQLAKPAQYNAFLFGNSKCNVFLSNEWKKHIGTKNKIANLSSPGERLLNIYKKIEHIEEQGLTMNHALFILDKKIINNSDGDLLWGPAYIHHPLHSDQNWVEYALEGLSIYLQNHFFAQYLTKVMGINHHYNSDIVLNKNSYFVQGQDLSTPYYASKDSIITQDSLNHTTKAIFRDTIGITQEIKLVKEDTLILKKIVQKLRKHNTQYRIIFGPYFINNQINKKELDHVKTIFGSKNVFDFSGTTAYTNKPFYWYDRTHYRTVVANHLMNLAYNNAI